MHSGGVGFSYPPPVSMCLNAGAMGRRDAETETLIPITGAVFDGTVCFSSKDYGADATDDLAPTLRASGHAESHANGGSPPAVAYSVALRGREGGATAELGDDVACALRTGGGGGDKPHALVPLDVLPFDTTQITSPINRSQPAAGDTGHPLQAGAHPPAVCVTGSVTHTLKAEGFDASEDGTGRGQPIVCGFQTRGSNLHIDEHVSGTIGTNCDRAGGSAPMVAERITVCHGTQDPCLGEDVAFTMGRNNGGENVILAPPVQMAVRRLMPIECERLQGFPDNWTRIPVRHYKQRKITKTRPAHQWEPDPNGGWWLMAADGPRYKQLGNSMAVPCMRWLGWRIRWWLMHRDVIVDLIA